MIPPVTMSDFCSHMTELVGIQPWLISWHASQYHLIVLLVFHHWP